MKMEIVRQTAVPTRPAAADSRHTQHAPLSLPGTSTQFSVLSAPFQENHQTVTICAQFVRDRVSGLGPSWVLLGVWCSGTQLSRTFALAFAGGGEHPTSSRQVLLQRAEWLGANISS